MSSTHLSIHGREMTLTARPVAYDNSNALTLVFEPEQGRTFPNHQVTVFDLDGATATLLSRIGQMSVEDRAALLAHIDGPAQEAAE